MKTPPAITGFTRAAFQVTMVIGKAPTKGAIGMLNLAMRLFLLLGLLRLRAGRRLATNLPRRLAGGITHLRICY